MPLQCHNKVFAPPTPTIYTHLSPSVFYDTYIYIDRNIRKYNTQIVYCILLDLLYSYDNNIRLQSYISKYLFTKLFMYFIYC